MIDSELSPPAIKRRVVRVPISHELLVGLMTEGAEIHARVVKSLPEDAIFVGSAYDPVSMCAFMFFAHESFDEVPEAAPVPSFMPVYQERPINFSDDPQALAVEITSYNREFAKELALFLFAEVNAIETDREEIKSELIQRGIIK